MPKGCMGSNPIPRTTVARTVEFGSFLVYCLFGIIAMLNPGITTRNVTMPKLIIRDMSTPTKVKATPKIIVLLIASIAYVVEANRRSSA